VHRAAQDQLFQAYEQSREVRNMSDLSHREAWVSSTYSQRELAFRQWSVSREERFRQLSQMVRAKQKLDVVDKLIEHQSLNERYELDQKECRVLDDLAQNRRLYQEGEAS
jgi:hypothetical protein